MTSDKSDGSPEPDDEFKAGFQPFSRIATPFTIGLRPVDPDRFLHIDEQLSHYRAEKLALMKQEFGEIVRTTPDSHNAQLEAHELIVKDLKNHPQSPYRFRDGGAVDNLTGEQIDFSIWPATPIAATSLLVQDDLVIMQRDETGWRLTATSLAFPSSWSLKDKFGKSLEDIHKPVPYIAGKMGDRIRRIFDALRPDCPLWRENWALVGDPNLRHEQRETAHRNDYRIRELQGDLYIRTEYQTLHKLPESQAILFTIKIMNQPLDLFASDPEKSEALKEQFLNLGEEGLAYKGLTNSINTLVERLG